MSAETEIAAMQSRLVQLERAVEALRANSGRQVTRQAIGGGGGGGGLRIVIKNTKAELDAVVDNYSAPTLGFTLDFHRLYSLRSHRWDMEIPPVNVWICVTDGEEYVLEMPPISLFVE